MDTYCEPIRHTDWHWPEPEESWYEVEGAQDEVRWILELIDRCVQEGAIRRNAQLLAEALADVRSVEATDSLEERFREQADKWERETRHVSSPTQMMMHPSYHAILGMGKEAVPLLLRDLQQNRRPWFWALSYLTHENPINPKDAGKMDTMIKAWVDWGKKKGLL